MTDELEAISETEARAIAIFTLRAALKAPPADKDPLIRATLDWLTNDVEALAEGAGARIVPLYREPVACLECGVEVVDAARAVIAANADFRAAMKHVRADWDGDPLQDACARLERALSDAAP